MACYDVASTLHESLAAGRQPALKDDLVTITPVVINPNPKGPLDTVKLNKGRGSPDRGGGGPPRGRSPDREGGFPRGEPAAKRARITTSVGP